MLHRLSRILSQAIRCCNYKSSLIHSPLTNVFTFSGNETGSTYPDSTVNVPNIWDKLKSASAITTPMGLDASTTSRINDKCFMKPQTSKFEGIYELVKNSTIFSKITIFFKNYGEILQILCQFSEIGIFLHEQFVLNNLTSFHRQSGQDKRSSLAKPESASATVPVKLIHSKWATRTHNQHTAKRCGLFLEGIVRIQTIYFRKTIK